MPQSHLHDSEWSVSCKLNPAHILNMTSEWRYGNSLFPPSFLWCNMDLSVGCPVEWKVVTLFTLPQYTAIVLNDFSGFLALPVILIWMETSHDFLIYFLQAPFQVQLLLIWPCKLPPPNTENHSFLNPPSNSKLTMSTKPWNSDLVYIGLDLAT